MSRLFILIALVSVFSCVGNQQQKIPCYAWIGNLEEATDKELLEKFTELKGKGIDGLMYHGGHDPKTYRHVGNIAKEADLEFHAWIPTLIQQKNPKLKPEWYAINGLGESAFDKPAYVDHYKFLCPNRNEVYDFLDELYGKVADVPEVDGIHLDFIRFPDVILARGLWEKYNLVMDREYPRFDYCYCDQCVNDFRKQSGIDIRSVEDPSRVREWKQFRYDLITDLVNHLSGLVRSKDKEITAAVFPGPESVAKKIVRQEWDQWMLDAFYPMNYNDFYLEDTQWIGAMCREGVSSIDNRAPLYSGLFICPDPTSKANEPDPENHGLVPEELEDAIRQSMVNGATGICLFTPDRMTEGHWEIFSKAIRQNYTDKVSIQ